MFGILVGVDYVCGMKNSEETLKRIGWKIAGVYENNFAGNISNSKAREEVRVLVAQEIVDHCVGFIPKSKQRDFVRSLGFYSQAECARLMGCSRQNVNQQLHRIPEKIFFLGKWWYKP